MYNGQRVAFITGAGRGIGAAIAHRVSRDGLFVCVTDLDGEQAASVATAIQGAGRNARSYPLDVTRKDAIRSVVGRVEKEVGPIDVLVNNAGVSTMNYALALSEEEWDFNFDVNAKGVFLVSQVVAKRMVDQQIAGKIVTIASMAGKRGVPLLAHYAASKWAVIGFCKSLALELAPYRINVNCVCPGYVQTSMQEREVEWEAKLRGITPEQVIQGYLDDTPLGRLETPDDVANVVSFLVSDDASFMTGQAINVTGGSETN